MRRSIKAELLKLTTTRSTYGLIAGAVAVVALTVGSTIASSRSFTLSGPLHDHVFFLLTSINVGLFSLILGMKVITDEYRNDTIIHAFLSDPKRTRTVIAKGIAAAVTSSVMALVSLATLSAIAIAMANPNGGGFTLGGSEAAFMGFVASNALWAILGVAIGALIRHQVAVVVGGLVWVLVIENLGSGFLGQLGPYLPGQAAYALSNALDSASALEPSVAGIVMSTYALIALVFGIVMTRMRDVATS